MKIIYTSLAVIIFAAGALGQNTKAEADIRKVMNDQTAAWNRGDIAGFMGGYWRSDNLTFVSGTEVTRGWLPMLDRYKKSYDTRAKMGMLTFSDLEITILGKDAAVVLGTWSVKRDADNPHGKFTLTFRKLKEGWRIIMDHTS